MYVGFGSFLFHASMTDIGFMLDLAACYTLSVVMIPYQFLNGVCVFFFGSPSSVGSHAAIYAPLFFHFGVAVGMVLALLLPYWYWHYTLASWMSEALVAIPISAGLNFSLFFLHLFLNRSRARIRRPVDFLWIAGAMVTMGGAYAVQVGDYGPLCNARQGYSRAFFQPHAFWHVFMSIGVLFFYFFMRQERRVVKTENDKELAEEVGAGVGLEGQLMANRGDPDSVL